MEKVVLEDLGALSLLGYCNGSLITISDYLLFELGNLVIVCFVREFTSFSLRFNLADEVSLVFLRTRQLHGVNFNLPDEDSVGLLCTLLVSLRTFQLDGLANAKVFVRCTKLVVSQLAGGTELEGLGTLTVGKIIPNANWVSACCIDSKTR